MNFSKYINVFRRFLMNQITKNLVNSYADINKDKIKIQRVLICRPNKRLGNLILITPLLDEVSTRFPDCKIDLFVKGFLGPILFKNHENVNQFFTLPKKPFSNLIKYFAVWTSIRKYKYDLVINVDSDSSSGRLATKFSRAKFRFYGEITNQEAFEGTDYEHLAKYPIYNLRKFLDQLGFEPKNDPISSLDIKLDAEEIKQGKETLNGLVKNNNKTISLFTFATGDKCYSNEWWEYFYQRLQKQFPDYNFIEILPIENISSISFKAPTFYSSDVREIAGLIANTAMFIGADSGIMHLASASKTPTVGLFSVTYIEKYRPYNNRSIGLNTNHTSIDECLDLIYQVEEGATTV